MKEQYARFLVCALGFLVGGASSIGTALCQSPVERIPLAWPTAYVDCPTDAPAGEIAYLLRVMPLSAKMKVFPLDLVIHTTGKSAGTHKQTTRRITSTQAYPYATEFSPSGKWILVKTTFPSSPEDAYQLQFWDEAAARMQVGPTLVGYPETRWSPDSRFMAYFQGGDVFGGESRGDTALQLHVYSLGTGKSRMIVENPEAKSFCWTNQHTLLYTFKSDIPQETAFDYFYKKPNIYEASLTGKSAHLLIPDGFDPAASPDGRWVAFKGWSTPAAKPATKSGASAGAGQEQFGLYLYDRRTRKRTLLHALPQRRPAEDLLWSSDSAYLFSIRNDYTDTHPAMLDTTDKTLYPGSGKGYVSDISVPALTRRDITLITTSDSIGRSDPQNQILFHGISQDGKSLYITVEERQQQSEHSSLRSINIENGDSQTILDGQGVLGVGWREVSPLRK